jgi:large subunit ribosomal protein L24
MNKEFSTHWIGSKRPGKQRKYRAEAPLHLRKKFVSINLSKELRKKIGKRNIPVKKDDKVKILRGKYNGKTGKILEVLLKKSKVIVDGINVTKRDGSKANVKLEPSNMQIIEMAERKKKPEKKINKESKEIVKEKPKTETPKKQEKKVDSDKKPKENKK